MDASQALAELTEISAQIEAAVIAGRSGDVVASTIRDEERAGRFARAAAGLLTASEEATSLGSPIQLEAVLGDASVFVVREDDRLIAAVTSPDPTVGLVFYDLKSCLRSVKTEEAAPPTEEAAPPKKPRAPRQKKEDEQPKEDAGEG